MEKIKAARLHFCKRPGSAASPSKPARLQRMEALWNLKGSVDDVVFTYANLRCPGFGVQRRRGACGGVRFRQQDGLPDLCICLRQDVRRRDREKCRRIDEDARCLRLQLLRVGELGRP